MDKRSTDPSFMYSISFLPRKIETMLTHLWRRLHESMQVFLSYTYWGHVRCRTTDNTCNVCNGQQDDRIPLEPIPVRDARLACRSHISPVGQRSTCHVKWVSYKYAGNEASGVLFSAKIAPAVDHWQPSTNLPTSPVLKTAQGPPTYWTASWGGLWKVITIRRFDQMFVWSWKSSLLPTMGPLLSQGSPKRKAPFQVGSMPISVFTILFSDTRCQLMLAGPRGGRVLPTGGKSALDKFWLGRIIS